MNAIELSERLSPDLTSIQRIDAEHAGEMLLRQHEAIQKLREALAEIPRYFTFADAIECAEQALADTEGFK